MSLIGQQLTTALATLLKGLQSAENITRKHAEDGLQRDWVDKQPEILLMGLAEQMQGSKDLSVSSDSSGIWCAS